jgi:hypothetical protein
VGYVAKLSGNTKKFGNIFNKVQKYFKQYFAIQKKMSNFAAVSIF